MFDIYFDLEDMHQTVDEEIAGARDDHDSWAFEQVDFDFVKDLDKSESFNKSAGCFCASCNDFCQFAEPNQPNGTLICYYCRNYG